MRRPARRLFTLCSAASLLLCVAVCVLWVRCYLTPDSLGISGSRYYGLKSTDGLLTVASYPRPPAPNSLPSGPAPRWECIRPTRHGFAAGQVVFEEDLTHGMFEVSYVGPKRMPSYGYVEVRRLKGRYVRAPYWFLFACTAAFPLALAGRAWRGLPRADRPRCDVCGYDLRATPGRCPECGMPRLRSA
jgi:hypothetical protein